MNFATAEQLSLAIQQFENDPDSPVGILYGVGGNFCSGYDLKELVANKEQAQTMLLRSEGAMVRISHFHIAFDLEFLALFLGTNTSHHQKTADRRNQRLLRRWRSRVGADVRSPCDGV